MDWSAGLTSQVWKGSTRWVCLLDCGPERDGAGELLPALALIAEAPDSGHGEHTHQFGRSLEVSNVTMANGDERDCAEVWALLRGDPGLCVDARDGLVQRPAQRPQRDAGHTGGWRNAVGCGSSRTGSSTARTSVRMRLRRWRHFFSGTRTVSSYDLNILGATSSADAHDRSVSRLTDAGLGGGVRVRWTRGLWGRVSRALR